jgi:hypothetical protein
VVWIAIIADFDFNPFPNFSIVKIGTFQSMESESEISFFISLGDKYDMYLKGGVTDPDPTKHLPINGLTLASIFTTVGSGCFTPPKKVFTRRIEV